MLSRDLQKNVALYLLYKTLSIVTRPHQIEALPSMSQHLLGQDRAAVPCVAMVVYVHTMIYIGFASLICSKRIAKDFSVTG